MNYKFTKEERLRKTNEFRYVFENGKVFKDKNFVAHLLLNNRQNSRLGIVVKKKIGNAVKRNRTKRLFRDAFRTGKNNLTKDIDIIIIPRIKAEKITYPLAKGFIEKLSHYTQSDQKFDI